jgi:hypothetical protein
MAKILDIVNGISQVLSYTADCAHDSEGEPVKIGLRREEGDPLLDERVMDGFSVRFQGDTIIVSYQCDCKLKELHDKNFESDTESKIEAVVSYIKKEYRKLTGNSLGLQAQGEVDVLAQYLSRVRTTVIATKVYKISGAEMDRPEKTGEDRLDDTFRKFLELGSAGKKPKNATAKSDNYKPFEPWAQTTGQRNPNLK